MGNICEEKGVGYNKQKIEKSQREVGFMGNNWMERKGMAVACRIYQ